jgi:hypothetical protein
MTWVYIHGTLATKAYYLEKVPMTGRESKVFPPKYINIGHMGHRYRAHVTRGGLSAVEQATRQGTKEMSSVLS